MIDLDIRKFFDTVPWDLVEKAVVHHISPDQRWILLYVRRWLQAPLAQPDGTLVARDRGTPRSRGRLVVRPIPILNHGSDHGQATLFHTWRFHAFFTTTDLDTITADKTHRGHAIIEGVHADLKDSALAHLPSGRFNANAAWLVLAANWRSTSPAPRPPSPAPGWREPGPPPSAGP